MQNLIESIEYNIKSIESALEKKSMFLSMKELYEKDILKLDTNIEFIKESKTYYVKAVDVMYEESIGSLKDTLNMALQYIMYDKNYTVNMALEDKRGTKTLDISLIDLDEDFEVDLRDGVGNSIRTIISFVLKMYYLLNKDSRILFLDEKYSALSAHYIPQFFNFLKKMTEEKHFIIVMISHIESQIEFADRTYMINDGRVSLIEKDKINIKEINSVEEESKLTKCN